MDVVEPCFPIFSQLEGLGLRVALLVLRMRPLIARVTLFLFMALEIFISTEDANYVGAKKGFC